MKEKLKYITPVHHKKKEKKQKELKLKNK